MSPRRVFLFALPRSGSTMLCDRLTLPGKSVMLHEPMVLRRIGDGRERRIVRTLQRLGHDVSDLPTPVPGEIAQPWFDKEILPRLDRYRFWGLKEVYLHDAMQLIERYRPEELLVLWRDPRDVALSFLELMNRAMMSYADRRTLKDEAWALECLRVSAEQLSAISKCSHAMTIRYEDLVQSTAARTALREHLGLPHFGSQRFAIGDDPNRIRTVESLQHDSDWSDTSIGRWQSEPSGWRKTFAAVCSSAMQPHATLAGYAGKASLANQVLGKKRVTVEDRISNPMYEPEPGFDFAYAKRRGRRRIASFLRTGERVLDIGGTTAGLAFMTDASVTVVDDGAEGRRVVRRDWKAGVLPKLDQFETCTFIASLEYVAEPEKFLVPLLRRGLNVHVTYHCKDDLCETVGDSLGFRSHRSRKDWIEFASKLKVEFRAAWKFDGWQSHLQLHPSDGTIDT